MRSPPRKVIQKHQEQQGRPHGTTWEESGSSSRRWQAKPAERTLRLTNRHDTNTQHENHPSQLRIADSGCRKELHPCGSPFPPNSAC